MFRLPIISFLILGLTFLILANTYPVYAQQTTSNQFIVVLKDNEDTDKTADDLVSKHNLNIEHRYHSLIRGFSAIISKDKLAKIKSDPRVKFISEDKEVHTFGQVIPTGVNRINAPVNLNQGTGVGVAVIDTGVDLTHPDLKGNIVADKNCVRRNRNGNDDNGHGSHVAGTIAAQNNTIGVVGVAPQAKLITVKVLDSRGSGTWSSVICGLDWVTQNASRFNIKVANMSLGGSGFSDNNCGHTNSDALHQAICRTRDSGVTLVVAAGNSSTDANSFVPASYDDAVITVSALADSDGKSGGLGSPTNFGPDDTFASFNNFGSVVDLGAPGVNIYSTYKGGGYATMSGTSMATPHVSAAAALFIKSHPGSSWTQVRDGLKAVAESLGSGHTDPSNLHPEPVLRANAL